MVDPDAEEPRSPERPIDFSGEPFRSAKKLLKKIRGASRKTYLQTAAVVESLAEAHPNLPEEELVAWLCSEGRVSYREAVGHARLRSRMGGFNKQMDKLDLNVDIIQHLLVADDATQAECLLRLAQGETIDYPAINDIYKRNRAAARSEESLARSARNAAMRQAADRFLVDLERGAAELVAMFVKLQEEHAIIYENDADEDGENGWFETQYDLDDEKYLQAVVEIREAAAEVLRHLEALFGSEHAHRVDILEIALKDDFEASVALSWHALVDLSAGRFAGYDVEPWSDDPRRLRQCTEFLAGSESRAVPLRTTRKVRLPALPSKSLRMVDIAAGIGGAVLGLESAGFHPVAAYEFSLSARKLMDENYPAVSRPQMDPLVGRYQFAPFTGKNIALVTSGTSLKHFSLEPRAGRLDPSYDNFGHAINAIRTVSPSAFFFEVDPRMQKPENLKFRRHVETIIEELGYDIRWSLIEVSRIGLPQIDPRLVMVGMRDGRIRNLEIPVMIEPVTRTVVDAIGDLVSSHIIGDDKDSKLRLDWVESWRADCADKLAPMIVNWTPHAPASDKWADIFKIEVGKYTSSRPTAEEIADPAFRLRLTAAMLARIQGIPDEWSVTGANGDWHRDLIETAVPPVLAKLVGLAVFSALTDEKIDIQKSMSVPLRQPPPPVKKVWFGNRYAGRRWSIEVPDDWSPRDGLRKFRYISDEAAQIADWRATWKDEDEHPSDAGADTCGN
jgi:site-specific DNA-cytosine methylase